MYLNFYGLEQEPFRLTPDPRFLHLADPHRKTLRSMLEGIGARRGLQVVTGAIGTGKTTLLYALQHILALESSAARPLFTAFLVNPTLTPPEFYEALLDELEIPSKESKPSRLRALHELLLKAFGSNGNVVVVVDEAHLIFAEVLEEIRLLLNFDNYPKSVLQVILCGQPELMSSLENRGRSALMQRIAVVSQLRALILAETRAYVAERLHVAGLGAPSPFTPVAIEDIHRFSNGVPRLINILCDLCLRWGYRARVQKIGSDCVREAAEELRLAGSPLERLTCPAEGFSKASTL